MGLKKFAPILVLIVTLFLGACGGGGSTSSSGSGPATGTTVPQFVPNFIRLQSDAGDYIGLGSTYNYDNTNAKITVTAQGGHLSVSITGDLTWNGDFVETGNLAVVQPGSYSGLTRYPLQQAGQGGLSWYGGKGGGCDTLTGSFTVDNVSYSGSQLASLDLRFEQHCEGSAPALHGEIHWTALDTSAPSGPVSVPTGLWQPAASSTPATGNYIYLESDSGDVIGGGRSYLYTQVNAQLSFHIENSLVNVRVTGDQNWTGAFQIMSSINRLQTGYYGSLMSYPSYNPTKGGFDWSGQGWSCGTAQSWVVVDNIVFAGDSATALDLRFEQHCQGATPALHGKIHWVAGDTTSPLGPTLPIPVGLWQAPAGSVPTSGNYVYLQSDAGDYIGQGQTNLYAGTAAPISASYSSGDLKVVVGNNLEWTGDFAHMVGLSQMQVGYYSGLQRYPFQNPAKGGLSWYGQGRGCNTLQGWFAIDRITYANGMLSSVDLRFEQHCEGGAPALHGQVHWANN
jgi:hypothetical protein